MTRWPPTLLAALTCLVAASLVLSVREPPALAAVPVPTDYRVHHEKCPEDTEALIAACANTATGDIYLPVAGSFALQHELGHLVDAQLLTDGDRRWFTRRLGMSPGLAWRDAAKWRTPSEVFADAYAACALKWSPGRKRGRWEVAYDYIPSLRQHRRVCAGLDRVAARLRLRDHEVPWGDVQPG